MTDLAAALAERPPLDVTADLTLAVDGTEFRVESYTDRLFVDVPSLLAAVRLLRATTDALPRLARLFAAAGLTVVLRAGGRTVAVAGADARPGPLARRLGPVELRVRGLLAAAAGELPRW